MNPIHIPALAVAIAVAAMLPAACSTDGSAGAERSAAERPRVSSTAADLERDLGGDWAESATVAGGAAGPAGAGAPGGPSGGDASSTYWSILLRSFTTGDHAGAAANMVRNAATIDPQLAHAHVETTADASLVLYGSYRDPEDADAQRDLAWIKGLMLRRRLVFPTAMLTRINPAVARGSYRPGELMSVRLRYPTLHPLYTLQVAVWTDASDREKNLKAIQGRAEEYARQLRSEGFEAYFYHDADRRMSMVTVGLFDHTAIDPQSGFYAPEVESLLAKFPRHLVNGEPVDMPIDPRRPKRGTRPQTPQLVLVPRR